MMQIDPIAGAVDSGGPDTSRDLHASGRSLEAVPTECASCGPTELCLAADAQLPEMKRCVPASCKQVLMNSCGVAGEPRCSPPRGECSESSCELGSGFCVQLLKSGVVAAMVSTCHSSR